MRENEYHVSIILKNGLSQNAMQSVEIVESYGIAKKHVFRILANNLSKNSQFEYI